MRSRFLRSLFICAAFLLPLAVLDALSLSTTIAVSQNFDGMGVGATATLPPDFRADNPSTVRTVGSFAAAGTATARAGGANLASNAANGIYNFGAGTASTGNSDRAVGWLSSGTATASGNLYTQLANNTGGDLSGLQVSYAVEKYRLGTNTAGFCVQLYYSTSGAAGSWTSAGVNFLTTFPGDPSAGGNAGFATAPGATQSVNQTLNVAVPNGTNLFLAWNYSVCSGSTTTNGQALAVDDVAILGIGAGGGVQTNPSATTNANPSSIAAGQSTTLSVSVTPGTNPPSTAIGVTADLTSIGINGPQQFFDDGTHGDVTPNDLTFTLTATVSAGTTPGAKSLPFTITDAQGRSASSAIAVTVTAVDTPPTVTGSTPANSATNVPVTSTVIVNFSESVSASPGAFSIECPVGSQQTFTTSASPASTFTLTPAAPLPYATSCTVTVSGTQVTDIDGTPDALVGNPAFSFTTTAAPPPGAGKVMINEIDADTPGSDTAEFIELYDGGSGNTPLDGLAVVLYDGGLSPFTGNQVYAAFDLTGYSTDANGYFVLGNPGVPNAVLTFDPGQFGLLQNGPDAVALYVGHASDFPVGKVVTTTNLLDAVVYGTDDPAPVNLMSLINVGQKIVNEDATGNGTTQSSQRCPNGMGGFRNTSPFYPGGPTPGAANTCPPARPPSDVVISQIYGGGGNSGAIYQNDYVELYNRGSALADLTGWSLQYSSATGSSWDLNRQPIGGSIGPGEYYLIQLASGGANGVPLPVTPNIVSQINISATNGNVALVSSYAGLVGACPIFDPSVKDLVGYGTADCGEGSTTAPGLSNTTALFRKSSGGLDTDNNANDFGTPTTPSPRRTALIVELGPAVLTTDPSTNGTDAPRDATIFVTFTEAVNVDNGWFSLTCASSGAHSSATFASNRGGQDQYITPNDNFIAGEQCSVTIFKDRVHDVDLDDSAPNTDTLAADYSWSFTVATGAAPPEPPSVHLTMGNPSNAGTDPLNYLMEKPEFALSYNRDLGRPNWVSWHLSDGWLGTLTRADTFRPDPQVPPDWYRVQSFDFSGSGFDRGHMTPNADRDNAASIPINQATFLMSNMVAQAPANNQGPWAQLESALRDIVAAGNELYIVSGPAGAGGTGSNFDQNGQPFVTTTLANGHVTVPASTWKVALVLSKADGDDVSRVSCSTRTIAVIMPNSQAINADWTTYLTTVDAVETLTGFDFFSNVPEPYQRCIEAGTNGNNPPLVNGNQTITFPQPADSIYGDPPFAVSATGGASGNPVTFTASGACSSSGLNGATITVVAAGSCTITASQAGSAIYNAAAPVVRTLNVGRAAQTIAFATLPNRTYGDPPFTVSAGGGASGNAVTFVASGACTSSGPTVQITAAGVCNVTASQAGNANYAAAADVAQTFAVGAAPLTVSAANATREYNTPNPSFTGTLVGVVPGDNITASFGSTAVLTSLPGVYAITPVLSDPLSRLGNYAVTTHNGVLTITDTTPPSLTLPANITIAETSAAGRVVTYAASASDLVDGAVSISCAPASGSLFAVGTTTVHCSASDAHGNSASGSFTVTVTTDRRAPRITDPGRIVVEATGPAGAVVVYAASALDAHDGTVPVVCVPASGSTFPLGKTTVTCTATDASGNVATDEFPVTVRDTTDPDIVSVTPPSGFTLSPTGLMTPVTFAVVVNDLVDPNPSCAITRVTSNVRDVDHDGVPDWSLTGPLSVSLEAATRKHKDRQYVITIKCTDTSGNSSKEKTTVVVSHLP